MKLLSKEWDLIIRALNILICKIEADSQTGFRTNCYVEVQEIKTLIERIELNRESKG